MEQAGLPVAQSPYSDAGSLEVVDQHARAGHNAGQGIAEVLDVIVEDVGPLVALALAHNSDGLLGAGAAVHEVVDIVETGDVVIEKCVDGLLAVTGDKHCGRIPVDQYIAEVENHVSDWFAGVRGSFAVCNQHIVIHIRLSGPTLHGSSSVLRLLFCNHRFTCWRRLGLSWTSLSLSSHTAPLRRGARETSTWGRT